MIVPFSVLPPRQLTEFSKLFRAQAKVLSKNIPEVEKQLKKLEPEFSAIDYFSIGLTNALLLFVLMFAVFFALGRLSATALPIVSFVAFAAAASCTGIFYSFLIFYPRLLIEEKKQNLEKTLPFALRYLLVQVSSGVPLYNAIVDVASSSKGEVSGEFLKVIKRTEEGIGFTDALEESSMKNPSHFYKRVMLQISNASRSGTDISNAISEIIKSVSNEQRISMKVYSSNLNILTMMYMMLTIILPTLGIVLLVILSNFVAILLSTPLYAVLVVLLLLIQYLFLGIIESKRPVVAV